MVNAAVVPTSDDISAAVDCNAVEPNDLIFRRLSLPPENVSAGRDENYDSPKIGSAAVKLDVLIFRSKNLPPDEILPRLPVTR